MNSKLKIQNSKLKSKEGVTLIEILVAIGIIVTLTVLSITSFYSIRKEASIEITAKNIVSALRFAKNKTLASEQASQYGIYFNTTSTPDQYILFKGSSYSSRDTSADKIYSVEKLAEIYEINLGSGQEIVFDRVTGDSLQSGNIKIRLVNDVSRIETITIDSSGRISIGAEGAGSSSPPQTDTRHIHFNLGWSIQNSLTLTLRFPDTPEVVENIDMAPYFNAGKTEFDMERSVSVNGETQKLRVHTHLLDAVNTILSVTRDRRENTKPLEISIDSKGIVSYAADGEATVGVYGGTMEIQ